MLTSIHIKNFRSLRDVRIEPLKRVNLITGQNDTGKTTVLEALRLLLAQPSPANCSNLANEFRGGVGRGDSNENFWKWLIYNKGLNTVSEIRAKFDGQAQFGIVLRLDDPDRGKVRHESLTATGNLGALHCFQLGVRPAKFPKAEIFSSRPSNPNQDAIDYNRVILKRGKRKVEDMLRKIDPRVQSIEPLQAGEHQGPLIYVDVGLKEMIPVTNMGQGFNRLLDMYSEVVAGEVNVLLIDEIENGLHHSVLPVVWEGLLNAVSELKIQIFATTHSWECIAAADAAARKSPEYELNLIRLDRVGDDVKATIIDEKTLTTAKTLEWEMR
jgi:predicted ATPase